MKTPLLFVAGLSVPERQTKDPQSRSEAWNPKLEVKKRFGTQRVRQNYSQRYKNARTKAEIQGGKKGTVKHQNKLGKKCRKLLPHEGVKTI